MAGKDAIINGLSFAPLEDNLRDSYAGAQLDCISAGIEYFEYLTGVFDAGLQETGRNVHHEPHTREAAPAFQ